MKYSITNKPIPMICIDLSKSAKRLLLDCVYKHRVEMAQLGQFIRQMEDVALELLLDVSIKNDTKLELSSYDAECLCNAIRRYTWGNLRDNMIYVTCSMVMDTLTEAIEEAMSRERSYIDYELGSNI